MKIEPLLCIEVQDISQQGPQLDVHVVASLDGGVLEVNDVLLLREPLWWRTVREAHQACGHGTLTIHAPQEVQLLVRDVFLEILADHEHAT